MNSPVSLARRASAEALATFFLLAAVVGSGIMAERLSGSNVALALLANTVATGAALVALILAFGPTSGAHMNPAVTVVEAAANGLRWRDAGAYLVAQILGAFAGVVAAHAMFGAPPVSLSSHARSGTSQQFSELVATFGLVLIVRASSSRGERVAAVAVGGYITAAYWFTASTSFANPAVTLARSLTNSFSGVRAADVPGFLAAQCLGAIAAALVSRWLFAPSRPERNAPLEDDGATP